MTIKNQSTQRIVMTSRQSLIKFGNPYGDYANMFLQMLNAAYKSRLILASCALPQQIQEMSEEIAQIDLQIKEGTDFLREHEQARPWSFAPVIGYFYKDLSESNWEGRMSNR